VGNFVGTSITPVKPKDVWTEEVPNAIIKCCLGSLINFPGTTMLIKQMAAGGIH